MNESENTTYQKPDKDTMRRENYRQIYLMNMNKQFAIKYQQIKFRSISKGLYMRTKWDLFLECKDGSTYEHVPKKYF